jgi:hypothetical protein
MLGLAAYLSNRCHLGGANVEQQRESIFHSSVSRPRIHPKLRAATIHNHILRTQLKQVFDFMEATPKLRAPSARVGKNIIHRIVLCP